MIRKSKSCLKGNPAASIVCWQNLMTKLEKLYKTACSTLQAKLSTMQNDWRTTLAERTQQRYADVGDVRAFYETLNAVYEPSR